jgi:phosphate:Na+ symporter
MDGAMFFVISSLIGGIGLFLLGMILMTDGLKALAGNALRSWLERFTGTKPKAVLTGMSITALVQASSVTTMATIGFVSAGLLNFSAAISVIIGANLGTTSTGWIVSLLGLKLSIGQFILPFIGVGALLKLFGKGKTAHLGIAIAGFSTIFVGLQFMQDSMSGLSHHIDLSQYSASGIQARLMLVLVGILMTIIMQSSSAAIATTLTALAAGTISIEQAAALVIGQNLGSTLNAGIVAIGASVLAKRTALVHIIFNIGTGIIAFFLLPWFISLLGLFTEHWIGEDHALSLAAFHTAFNLLGAAIFLPMTQQLASLAEFFIREHKPSLTRNLNNSLISVPSLALDTVQNILHNCALITLQNAASRLRGEETETPLIFLNEVQQANREIAVFISKLTQIEGKELGQLNTILHALDHINQCAVEASNSELLDACIRIPELKQRSQHLADLFLLGAQALSDSAPPYPKSVAEQLGNAIQYSADARSEILKSTLDKDLILDDALFALTAQRRLEQVTLHAVRALHYLDQFSLDKKDVPKTSELDTSILTAN